MPELHAEWQPPKPALRRLQVYAFDPSLDTRLELAVLDRTVVGVPWEGPAELRPGPVGEYLEVVDVDPASGLAYPPVDLNDPLLLAQDGVTPSEGVPQFHQQMVYAVAMRTIWNFEKALGRRALWADRVPVAGSKTEDRFVRRLRVYPHALRQANAYYSPQKKALLFGYFPAEADDPGDHLAGGLVFACLSHDVVAHETTHALLHGLKWRSIEPTNPDMLAFHEAFADIVALLQHFSLPEVLRSQIAKTRGDLGQQSLLGELAQQFGRAIGQRAALRDALGQVDPNTGEWAPKKPDPAEIDRVTEPHERGSILVAAVFEAFVSIYRSRAASLLRLATGGTGVLPPGELHPELVNRLADEAAKAAQHVLTMCIRAIDYLPPVDVTFGEYLRALITSDSDLVPDDPHGYRIAFVEAFRRRGLYPRDLRTLSVESLRWLPPSSAAATASLRSYVTNHSRLVQEWSLSGDRERIWRAARNGCAGLHAWLKVHPAQLATIPGLRATGPLAGGPEDPGGAPNVFEVHAVRPARRVGPLGQFLVDLVVEITQRRWANYDGSDAPPGDPPDLRRGFWFRGGCSLIVDVETGAIRYAITKDITNAQRAARQQHYLQTGLPFTLRETYFGSPGTGPAAEWFAALHSTPVEEVR